MVESLPAEVRLFIERYIDTVPHMEALLLLWQTHPRRWAADEVGRRIYVQPPRAGGILDDLAQRELVLCDAQAGNLYQYHRDNREAAIVPGVADAYRRQLVPVSNYIHSCGSPAMREFARAFLIKGRTDK